MFTGIVEEKGKVISAENGKICISASKVLENTNVGDSIAVNGVCLTVTQLTSSTFTADVMNETLNRSNLGSLKKDSSVNLERAMSLNGRFGGHIVSGHIDGTGIIKKIVNDSNAVWIYIQAKEKILKLIVEKGSVAIDGVSLTVAKVFSDQFAVSIIPHTGEETTLLSKKIGDSVNLENDVIAKYVERLLTFTSLEDKNNLQKQRDKKIMDFLME